MPEVLEVYSGAAKVHKPSLPVATTHPVATSVLEGVAIGMTVAFNGSTPLIYQWQQAPDGSTWVDVAGQTTTTLTKLGVLAETGYSYRCYATDLYGQETFTNPAISTVTEVWTPAKLFDNGEDGGWYEIRPGNVWQDNARTDPAVEGDIVQAIGDLSGNGQHLDKSSGTAIQPTLERDANGYYLSFPAISTLAYLEFIWLSPLATNTTLGMCTAMFFSKGVSNGSTTFEQTIFTNRYAAASTEQAVSMAMPSFTFTNYNLRATAVAQSAPSFPYPIVASDLESYLLNMEDVGPSQLIRVKKDGAAAPIQESSVASGAPKSMQREVGIGSYGQGAKLRAMIALDKVVISDSDWASLDQYWKAMPK